MPSLQKLARNRVVLGVKIGLGGGFLCAIVGVIAAQLLVFGLAAAREIPFEALPAHMADIWFVGGASIAMNLAFCAGALVLVSFTQRSKTRALGLVAAPIGVFLIAPLGIIALSPTSDFLARTAKTVFDDWGYAFGGSLEIVNELAQSAPLGALILCLAIMPALGEEFLFRGVVQKAFSKPALRIATSAIGFSLMHGDPVHILGVLPLGFYFAWLAERTGSITLTIWLHFLNNSMALIAARSVAGQDDALLADGNLPFWAMPVGWLVFAMVVIGIMRAGNSVQTEP